MKKVSRIQRRTSRKAHTGGMSVQRAPSTFFGPAIDASAPGHQSIDRTLSSSGAPMDSNTRSFMEQRFNQDFAEVRVHNDSAAHQSAEAISADAYTQGKHIAFNVDQYQPSTTVGRKLLAHELTHVVQQSDGARGIQRKLQVVKPNDKIANPTGSGLVQTNGETVLSYLSEICGDAKAVISSGDITVDQKLCSGSTKDKAGKTVSNIQLSKTPAGCSCVCEMSASANPFKIAIDDTVDPRTEADDLKKASSSGSGATVHVPSPNGKQIAVKTKSGGLDTPPPWTVLAHELCGHAAAMDKGKFQEDFIGATDGRGSHTPTVEIENKIRQEHNMQQRGTHRDPCCGAEVDGLYEGTGATNCKDFLQTPKAIKLLDNRDTVLSECQRWRDEYNILNGTSFTLADAVPVKKDEVSPAEYRNDVYFNKDAPQTWFDPRASFNVSVTDDGKASFEESAKIITGKLGIKKVQLEGFASTDKPMNDPDYNTRLAKRRVQLIKSELGKRGVKPGVFLSFQPTIPGKTCVELEAGAFNCSDTESKPQTDPKDRRVVIRYTKF